MARPSELQPAYYDIRTAAEYVGYNPDYFRRLAKEYNIPTFGPKNNRFRPSDLIAFMENKNVFLRTPVGARRGNGFTPVSV